MKLAGRLGAVRGTVTLSVVAAPVLVQEPAAQPQSVAYCAPGTPPAASATPVPTLPVLELGADGRFTVVLSAVEGAHAVPGCEGLVVDLDDLWAAGDRLPEGEAEEDG